MSDDGWLKSSTGVKRKHSNHAPALEAPTSIPNNPPPDMRWNMKTDSQGQLIIAQLCYSFNK